MKLKKIQKKKERNRNRSIIFLRKKKEKKYFLNLDNFEPLCICRILYNTFMYRERIKEIENRSSSKWKDNGKTRRSAYKREMESNRDSWHHKISILYLYYLYFGKK